MILTAFRSVYCLYLPKFSWVFDIVNFSNHLWNYCNKKLDTQHSFYAQTAKLLMDNFLGLSYSPRIYLWSRHCFANSCKLVRRTVWQCVLDLYAMRIVYYVLGICVQQICKIIIQNESSNIVIRQTIRPSKIYCYTVCVSLVHTCVVLYTSGGV